jgi:hypothetical protein
MTRSMRPMADVAFGKMLGQSLMGHVVLQCGTTEVLARVGAEVLSGLR